MLYRPGKVGWHVLESEEGIGTNILAHQCLFYIGEITPALQVEWDAYWKLPSLVTTDICSILNWEGMSEILPCCTLLYSASWLFQPPLVMLILAPPH